MLAEIRRKLVHKEITLADALRMVREEGKRRLTDFRMKWIDHELNGYPSFDWVVAEPAFHLPQYRKLSGQYFARTPSGIWADVSDTKLSELTGFCSIPIGVIDEILADPSKESVDLDLGELMPNTPVAMRITRPQLAGIDESVRNLLIQLLDELEAEETAQG